MQLREFRLIKGPDLYPDILILKQLTVKEILGYLHKEKAIIVTSLL